MSSLTTLLDQLLRKIHDLAGDRARGFVFMVALIAPIIALSIISYVQIDRAMTREVSSRQQAFAQISSTLAEENLGDLINIGIILAEHGHLVEDITKGQWGTALSQFANIPTDFPSIDRIFIVSPDGIAKAVTLRPGVSPSNLIGQDFSSRDWYKGVSKNWTPYISEIYQRMSSPRINVIATAIPIKSSDGKVIGILVLQVSADSVVQWVVQANIGLGARVYYVDKNGRELNYQSGDISSQTIPADLSRLPEVQDVLKGNPGVIVSASPLDGSQHIIAYSPVTKYGYGVLVDEPTATAFSEVRKDLLILASVFGAIVFLGILFALLLNRTFGRLYNAEEQLADYARGLEQKVSERTKQIEDSNAQLKILNQNLTASQEQLKEKIGELERFEKITVGRELKMAEMKKELEELRAKS